MAFTRNVPQSNELLSVSQPKILDNFNSSDDVFGIDHYQFSNTTPNLGFHKKATFPDQNGHPASPLTNPTVYGTNQSGTQLGVLAYCKGPNRTDQGNQVSTPLTFIQSQETGISVTNGSTINIFDFTGINRCFCRFMIGNINATPANQLIVESDFWFATISGNPVFYIKSNYNTTPLQVSSSAYILTVKNNSGGALSDIYWSLQFLRIQ